MKRVAFIVVGLISVSLLASVLSIVPGRDRLPCFHSDLRTGNWAAYCLLGRNYVREGAVDVISEAHAEVETRHGPSPLTWLDASGPVNLPLWPHRSHTDGRQVDLSFYYVTLEGEPIPPPTFTGYFAYEPPEAGERQPCAPGSRPLDFGDPPQTRDWRWDEARTTTLVQTLIGDERVRRIFLEPHLADRMALTGHPKVRFAGCNAARHDDHIHIDLY